MACPKPQAEAAQQSTGDESGGEGGKASSPGVVVICRCEDVTLDEIRDLIAKGYTTVEEIKRITRCGMGPCQGRTCRQLVLAEIAKATATNIADLAAGKFRPPTKPVRLGGAVAAGGTSEGQAREREIEGDGDD
ncbi:MAG: (2Fe-2S)-binding protein [Betaproteobacteria bacterium]